METSAPDLDNFSESSSSDAVATKDNANFQPGPQIPGPSNALDNLTFLTTHDGTI